MNGGWSFENRRMVTCPGGQQKAILWRSRVREGASEARTAHAGGVEHASSSDGTQGTRGARFGGVPRGSWSLECVLVCMYSGALVLGLGCSVTWIIGPVLESHFCLLGILLHDDFETF